jgi:excisionase family DNA binding protein
MAQGSINITIDQLREIIRTEVQFASKEIFTSDEAAVFLGIEKSYLYHLTSDNQIPFSKPYGKKMYFSKHDLTKWALSNRTSSVYEIESKAATILATSKRK